MQEAEIAKTEVLRVNITHNTAQAHLGAEVCREAQCGGGKEAADFNS